MSTPARPAKPSESELSEGPPLAIPKPRMSEGPNGGNSVEDRLVDFNTRECEKLMDTLSDFMSQLISKR